MRILRLFTLVLISLAAVNAQARQPIFFSLYGGVPPSIPVLSLPHRWIKIWRMMAILSALALATR